MFLAKAVATAFLGWQAWDGLNRLQERRTTFAKALATARHRGKPLLIVGLPYGMYGCGSAADGDVVLDLRTLRQCPNQVQGSVEDLTRWSEKHFGAAFVSHVVEHTCDPRRAVAELRRVADTVYMLYPPWWSLSAWLVPGHTHVVWPGPGGGVQFVKIRERCNTPTYFGDAAMGRARRLAGISIRTA